MRFTWIALPALLVALTGTSGASPPPADEEPSGRERLVERATSSTRAPIVALPATGEASWKRLGAAEPERREAHPDGAAPPGSRANRARVMIRTVDLAGTAFIPEITRATTGFLSSSTTACPPPAGD